VNVGMTLFDNIMDSLGYLGGQLVYVETIVFLHLGNRHREFFHRFRLLNISERLKHWDVVETVHRLQGGQFHGFLDFPGSLELNQLGQVQPVDGFC